MKDGKICQRIGTTTKNLKVNLMNFTVACISFVGMADQAKTCLKVGKVLYSEVKLLHLKTFTGFNNWRMSHTYKCLLLLAYA